jgi:hypothetical protein
MRYPRGARHDLIRKSAKLAGLMISLWPWAGGPDVDCQDEVGWTGGADVTARTNLGAASLTVFVRVRVLALSL